MFMTHISIEYIIFLLFNAFKIEFYFLGYQHCNHCENESKEALSSLFIKDIFAYHSTLDIFVPQL